MRNTINVIVIPTETQDEINQDSTYDEVINYLINNDDAIEYDLGRYFQDQNDDNLGLHWAFLVDRETGEILNGLYNSQLGAI